MSLGAQSEMQREMASSPSGLSGPDWLLLLVLDTSPDGSSKSPVAHHSVPGKIYVCIHRYKAALLSCNNPLLLVRQHRLNHSNSKIAAQGRLGQDQRRCCFCCPPFQSSGCSSRHVASQGFAPLCLCLRPRSTS